MAEQARIIRWEDPPLPARSGGGNHHNRSSRFASVAAQLQTRPGEWALIQVVDGPTNGLASHIRKGHMDCFGPAGTFDAVTRLRDGKAFTYARYLGDEEGDDA